MMDGKTNHRFEVILAAFLISLVTMAESSNAEDSGDASISAFKALPLYRAVELSWEVTAPFSDDVTFQLLRSDTDKEGSYEEIAKVPYVKSTAKYLYIDKKIVKGSKYYYKLVIPGDGETHGPISAKGFFALPST